MNGFFQGLSTVLTFGAASAAVISAGIFGVAGFSVYSASRLYHHISESGQEGHTMRQILQTMDKNLYNYQQRKGYRLGVGFDEHHLIHMDNIIRDLELYGPISKEEWALKKHLLDGIPSLFKSRANVAKFMREYGIESLDEAIMLYQLGFGPKQQAGAVNPEEIIKVWDEIILLIKDMFKDNPTITQDERLNQLQLLQAISLKVMGAKSSISGLRLHFISYKAKGFKHWITRDAILEIYESFQDYYDVFGDRWNEFQEKIQLLSSLIDPKEKFVLEEHTLNIWQDLQYAKAPYDVKILIRKQLQKEIGDFLNVPARKVSLGILSRLFYNDKREGRWDIWRDSYEISRSDQSIPHLSTYFKWICELRDWSISDFINAIKIGGLEYTTDDIDITEFTGLKLQLEDLLKNILFSNPFKELGHTYFETFYTEGAFAYLEKFDFTLEVFYAYYHNLPENDRRAFTIKNLRDLLLKEELFDLGGIYENFGPSQFGRFKYSNVHTWNLIHGILQVLKSWVMDGRVDTFDYFIVLESAKHLILTRDIKPVMGYEQRFYSHFDLNRVPTEFSDIISYLKKVRSSPDNFPREFYAILRYASDTARSSQFSESPFKDVNDESLKKYIKNFYNEFIRPFIDNKLINELVSIAKKRKSDETFLTDFGEEIAINPSTTLNYQPSHDWVELYALKYIDSVIATEFPIYGKARKILVSGHIDLVAIIGENIYVIDYKPDLAFDPRTNKIRSSFINSIPQVASYGIMLKNMFGYKNVYAITFNEQGAWVYDAESALKSTIDFYKERVKRDPFWSILL